MAGQQWFGQLEGRIRRTVDELSVARKLIWYIPDMLQIARSGTHQGQAASILDQILPAISAGRLIVWTEATPTALARLLQLRPILRSVLGMVRIDTQSPSTTSTFAHAVIQRLAQDTNVTIASDCVPTAIDGARQYLSAGSLPGTALDLIRLTVSRAITAEKSEIGTDQVIATLSQLTGIPVSILDIQERIDLAAVRQFFSSRIIGQDEAVTCIVERIAMLKAGLTDPGKPIGVFLFAGPTGTGKTELAKTVATYLFGSVDRLIRLDMSEFQTAESTIKILGNGGDMDSLIARIRKQPFSVVLLDEFEKAHAKIWDLFLQVFDDGRLTDSSGHVADFRHCIIILTTNLGATGHQSSGLGFAPAISAFASDQVMRAVSQTYRPEFRNRLDNVIVFNPLSRQVMREILKKELNLILERRGLKERDWAVEWEASAQEFLLEKGFSPELGARPLKRAIDQYVLAPLAATIVERRFPEGDQFVFIRSDGRAIQAEFVDPNTSTPPIPALSGQSDSGKPRTLAAMILTPYGTATEVTALEAAYVEMEQSLESTKWEDLKTHLSKLMTMPDFWRKPDRYETLSRWALMDRVMTAARTAQSLRDRLNRGLERTGKHSREMISRLALQIHLICEGIKDVFEGAPIEVAILVEPALEAHGEAHTTQSWCLQLLDMYRAWANNRHMQLIESPGGTVRDLPMLLVSGFGAHRLLAQEVGLHILEISDNNSQLSRAAARVLLAIAPLGDLPVVRLQNALMEAFNRSPRASNVVRRYRGGPSPLVRNANGSWRTGKFESVLRGDFDLIAASLSQ
jgi:ATP-dependent Clp protease ATP-binding subunit ClpC